MRLIFLLFVSFFSSAYCQDTLTIMYYNLLKFHDGSPNERYDQINDVISYSLPDVFIACEIRTESATDSLLMKSFNTNGRSYYKRAKYIDGEDTDVMLFYNSDKLELKKQKELPTDLRSIIHYYLTYTNETDSVRHLNFFGAHLKASQDGA